MRHLAFLYFHSAISI
jgi:hypothetical protein